jgi:hypothetical protein
VILEVYKACSLYVCVCVCVCCVFVVVRLCVYTSPITIKAHLKIWQKSNQYTAVFMQSLGSLCRLHYRSPHREIVHLRHEDATVFMPIIWNLPTVLCEELPCWCSLDLLVLVITDLGLIGGPIPLDVEVTIQ